MSFAEVFWCWLSWVIFVAVMHICVLPRVVKKFDNEARLRRKVEIDNDPLSTPSKNVTRTP